MWGIGSPRRARPSPDRGFEWHSPGLHHHTLIQVRLLQAAGFMEAEVQTAGSWGRHAQEDGVGPGRWQRGSPQRTRLGQVGP